MPPLRVALVAGEASGDMHGAALVRALHQAAPDLRVAGIGGDELAASGMEVIAPAEELSLVGFSEVLPKLGVILGALRDMKRHLAQARPDLLVLIDFPDFNFRLGRAAHKLGVKVLYYISPQVWAWRPARARQMAGFVDHLACVFPFETAFFAQAAPQLPVTYVGHPLLDQPAADDGPPIPRPQGAPLVGLLPGSRMSEISRLLPLELEAGRLMQDQRPDLAFALPVAPGLDRAKLEPYLAQAPANLTLLEGQAWRVMRQADALISASGTATLQAALAGAPTVVVYKTGGFNYWLARRLVRVEHIAMPNLIAGRRVMPELVQGEATPGAVAAEALGLLADQAKREAMTQGLELVRSRLGGPGASQRTARLALEMMGAAV